MMTGSHRNVVQFLSLIFFLLKFIYKFILHYFIQSEVKLNPMVTPSHTFSRASITLSFDWFVGLSVFILIGFLRVTGLVFDTQLKLHRYALKKTFC